MTTRSVKVMLSWMNLTYESIGVVVVNYGQGIITIDDFDHLNEKYVDVLFRVLQRPRGNTGGHVQSQGCSVRNG